MTAISSGRGQLELPKCHKDASSARRTAICAISLAKQKSQRGELPAGLLCAGEAECSEPREAMLLAIPQHLLCVFRQGRRDRWMIPAPKPASVFRVVGADDLYR